MSMNWHIHGTQSYNINGFILNPPNISSQRYVFICAVAKARQRSINKDWKGGSQVPGERVYLDISSIKGESFGGSCFWALVVDDHTDYCWI
jgi:hypothetical protein